LNHETLVGRASCPRLISVYSLIGDEYKINKFRNDDQIISHIFSELKLTAAQILLTAD
jgi:Uma2 family endonuclease